MKIETKFNVGDAVFLVHEPEQVAWMIVGITIAGGAMGIIYTLVCGLEMYQAHEVELTYEKDPLRAIGV